MSEANNTELFVISTHHLLDHAPDNFLAKGYKYKLSGAFRFGTPGLALCVCKNGDDCPARNFQDALARKMPQKKFEVVLKRSTDFVIDGWQEATVDLLRSILTPEEFVSLLNLPGSARSESTNSNKPVKKKGKKKR